MLSGHQLAAALADAASALVWLSESERPLAPLVIEGVPADADPATVARLAGAAPGSRVRQGNLEDEVARYLQPADPSAAATATLHERHARLLALVRQHLADPVALRIGRVEIRVLLVGRDREGNLVGLETIAIET